jgi:hypothetical protein
VSAQYRDIDRRLLCKLGCQRRELPSLRAAHEPRLHLAMPSVGLGCEDPPRLNCQCHANCTAAVAIDAFRGVARCSTSNCEQTRKTLTRTQDWSLDTGHIEARNLNVAFVSKMQGACAAHASIGGVPHRPLGKVDPRITRIAMEQMPTAPIGIALASKLLGVP